MPVLAAAGYTLMYVQGVIANLLNGTGILFSKKITITFSIVLFILCVSSYSFTFNAYACPIVPISSSSHCKGYIVSSSHSGNLTGPSESSLPNPTSSQLYLNGPHASGYTVGSPTIGGAATSGAATGGAGSTGSPICYQGATCNFYGGQATSGAATGGAATGP